MKNTWNYLTLLTFGSYLVYLFFAGKLVYFIHPRYVELTFGAGVVLLGVAVVGLYQKFRQKQLSFRFKSLDFAIFVLMLVIIFVPVKSLSSESFSIRSSGINTKVSASETENLRKKFSFGVDSGNFTMYDWVMAKSLDDNSVFSGKNFSGTGFISPASDSRYFNLSRFVVSCCIVDATPASLMAKYDWQNEFHKDDWVEIKGTFQIENIDGKTQPVIVPTTMTKIDQPKNIYLNRG